MMMPAAMSRAWLSPPVSGSWPPAATIVDDVVLDGARVLVVSELDEEGASLVEVVDEEVDDDGTSLVDVVDEDVDDDGTSLVDVVDEDVDDDGTSLVDVVDEDVVDEDVVDEDVVDEDVVDEDVVDEDVVDEDVDDDGTSLVDVVDEDVVDEEVVGGVSQPVTQNTLCFTSAPCDPVTLMVSLTCQPWLGCCSKSCSSALRSYSFSASRPSSEPPPALSSPSRGTWSSRIVTIFPLGGHTSNVTSDSAPESKPYQSIWKVQPTCGSLSGWTSNSTPSTLTVPLFPGGLDPAPACPGMVATRQAAPANMLAMPAIARLRRFIS
jgi:hypothetical protein